MHSHDQQEYDCAVRHTIENLDNPKIHISTTRQKWKSDEVREGGPHRNMQNIIFY